jgi:hypothetical protein
MRRACVLAVVVASLSILASPAFACTCSEAAPSKCLSFNQVGLMFVGTVLSIENPPDETQGTFQGGESRYHFRVDENINGMKAKEVDVFSGRGGGDCSVHFQQGETYLVDLGQSNPKEKLVAVICSKTQEAKFAGPFLAELRARRDGKPHASLYGTLRRTQQPEDFTMYEGFDQPLAETQVYLTGGAKKWSTRTDSQGAYRFYNLPAGTYTFSADLPAHLELAQTILDDPLPPITVPPDACLENDLDALPTSRIHGRVLGPDGLPIKNVDVQLFRFDQYHEHERGWWNFQDDKGYFDFLHVTPGTYLIVVRNSGLPDPLIPYPRTFYPGTTDLNSAVPMAVGEGQQILDADIHVTPSEATRVIKIHVNWMNGPLPEHAKVHLEGSNGDPIYPQAGPDGVFQATIFRSGKYKIDAEQICDKGGERIAGPVFVDGSDLQTTEVTLTLLNGSCVPPEPDPDWQPK